MQHASSDEWLAWQQSTESAQATALVSSPSNDASNINFAGNLSAKTPFDVRPASGQMPIAGAASRNVVTTASAETPLANRSIDSTHRSVEEFFQLLDESYKQDPFLIKLPKLEMQLAAAQRVRGDVAKSTVPGVTGYEEIIKLTSLAGWPQAAQQEMLLAVGTPERLRWIGFAVQSNQRPKLDGLLDEAMWQVCPPMVLQTADAAQPSNAKSQASLRWSYDNRYLYIAVDCPRDRQRRRLVHRN